MIKAFSTLEAMLYNIYGIILPTFIVIIRRMSVLEEKA